MPVQIFTLSKISLPINNEKVLTDAKRTHSILEDQGHLEFTKHSLSIYESIETKSTLSDSDPNATVANEPGRITAEVQSNKLKQLLGQIKQS